MAGCDRFRDCDRVFGNVRMQELDHSAIDLYGAFAGVFRQIECLNYLFRPRHRVGSRREHSVARSQLPGMDQRLTIHSELNALPAFLLETLVVA